ncbi:MAG: hypothetical protein NC253_06755 [Ruminococcus sp.]|nr:hypothetical protein [Ruminococcus sp.]MCM1381792.1 hypothetical protein [Muribaculaceae bacterium]MCM1479166.1 hypothetical protein [Muribaculaceae bacterium]
MNNLGIQGDSIIQAENKFIDFLQNVVNCYSIYKDEMLKFIQMETVDLNHLADYLNKARLNYKLYSLLSEFINKNDIRPNYSDCDTFSCDLSVQHIKDIQADINEALRKIQKANNEVLDIDDDDEYSRVQGKIREERKKFRIMNEMCTSCLKVAAEYIPVVLNTSELPQTEVKYPNENAFEIKQSRTAGLTEQAFENWLVTVGGVAVITAKQYISNIHSIESLYHSLFCKKECIFGASSSETAKEIIEAVVQSDYYADVNSKRGNSFNTALSRFAQFAGISIDLFKRKSDRHSYRKTVPFQQLAVKVVDFDNPHDCTFYKPCFFTFEGVKYTAKDWIELYKKFLVLMYDTDNYRELLKECTGKPLYGRKIDFADNTFANELRKPMKISEDFYAEANLSAVDIVKHIKYLSDLCSINDGCIQIEYNALELADEIDDVTDMSGEAIDEKNDNNILVNFSQNMEQSVSGTAAQMQSINNETSVNLTDYAATAVSEEGSLQCSDDMQDNKIPEDKRITLKLNGNTVMIFNYSDALIKICNFAINCRPFRMARISGQNIRLKEKNVFFRKAVPEDGYCKLSNGSQVMMIDNYAGLQEITEMIKKYCKIDDDKIKLLRE